MSVADPRHVPVTRSEHYPLESETTDDEIGIRAMRVTYLDVGWGLDDTCQVTLGARASIGADSLSYEIDLSPDGARQLATLLERAADAATDASRSRNTARAAEIPDRPPIN